MAHNKEETVKKLSEAFAVGADVTAACAYAEITRQTFYNWCDEDKELKVKFDRLQENPVLKAYMTVNKNLDSVDTAKWYLEKKRKKEFGPQATGGGDTYNQIILNNSEGDKLRLEYEQKLRQSLLHDETLGPFGTRLHTGAQAEE